jgi:predicted ATPase/class 3 adenylate cyclase
MGEMPVGTVTFLFTDIEGSTRLWQEDEALMRRAVARHDQLLRAVVAGHGGVVFSTMGDGLAAAFQTASAAVSCAVEAQELLHRESWETLRPLRVRMGLHTGEAELREGDYFGTAVNRAARLAAVGNGGQILCSSVTAELAAESVVLVDLGEHRLRDLDRPMHVFQVGDGWFPLLASLSAFPGNLPVQLTSFVGRQEELAAVAKALQTARLVTLTGTGGVGKTRLAVQAAANLVAGFPDGVWLCELAPASDPGSMLEGLAAALGYLPAPGADLKQGIAKFMGSRRMLVMLDSCEHLLDPAADLAETLLGRCPNLVILATSREALEVRGERVIRLRSLPVPQTGARLEQLAGVDAARLFLDRADTAGADLALDAGDSPAIAEICRRLDGIPLAIELAAARVIALSPGQIAAHLDERFRLLTGGRRAAVERHHTLRATIDWSYALLSDGEQAVFNHLGVFPASFDTSAAQAVAAASGVEPWDVLDTLTSLVAKSMVNADRGAAGTTQYQMLESLRHYARERLNAAGLVDDSRRCHARHYAAAVAEIGAGLRGPDLSLWEQRFDVELENFRAAVTWALDSEVEEDAELAMVILGELIAGRSNACITMFAGVDEQAVERARRSPSPFVSLVMAGAALNAYYRADFPRARQLSRLAMQQVKTSPHPGLVLSVGIVFTDPSSLATELTKALQILDDIGADSRAYAQVHGNAAVMAGLFGNITLARQEAMVAVEMSRRIGYPPFLGNALWGFALACWQSDPGPAQAALEEAIQIGRAMGYDTFLPRSLALLAQLRTGGDDRLAALDTLREGLEIAQTHDDVTAVAVCLTRGAVIMATLGEHETAAVFLGTVTNSFRARRSGVSPNEIPDYNQFAATLRSQLGDDRYNDATTRGAAMTYEQINAFALAAVEDIRQH